MALVLLRIRDVLTATGYRSPTTIYTAIKGGLFPRPVNMGARAASWPQDEVQAVLQARIAGLGDEQVRQLVQQLHAKRLERVQEAA